MKKRILFPIFLFPFFLTAQDALNKGIKWIEDLTWHQVKAKAHKENKLIFLDCFATWCMPCKEMDKRVYNDGKVGNILNEHFISVKVQMDSTKNDNEIVRKWYSDASNFKNKFRIKEFPTYIFVNKDGEIIYKDIGKKDINDFIKLVTNVLNPENQYYTILTHYRNGKREIDQMIYLVKTSKAIGDNELEQEIGNACIDYLEKVGLHKKQYIQFVKDFTNKSTDKGFMLLYRNARKLNEIMTNSDYVQSYLTGIIVKEEIHSFLTLKDSSSSEIPWDSMHETIKMKYNKDYADRAIIIGKVDWYGFIKKWDDYTKNIVLMVEKYISKHIVLDNSWTKAQWNNYAWSIFEHSNNKKELFKAITWIKRLLKIDPNSSNSIDTYANLLYKVGKVAEAIKQEKKAMEIAIKEYPPGVSYYQDMINKMKLKKPTWPAE